MRAFLKQEIPYSMYIMCSKKKLDLVFHKIVQFYYMKFGVVTLM